MMFELPDSERILKMGNHAFIWEEHLSYFTESSVHGLAQSIGAELVWVGRYPYAFEDSLVVVLRFPEQELASVPFTQAAIRRESEQLLTGFSGSLAISRETWRTRLEALRDRGEKVAVFGAGHLAVNFVNFLGLSDLVDCVIDDHPDKVGMLMPGSHLLIVPSAALKTRQIMTCISTLSPESETKVKAKFVSYFEEGGRFISAFSTN